jgi:TPR repeat protein
MSFRKLALATTIATLALTTGLRAETVLECDRLATDHMDRARVTDGASFQSLMSDEAQEACTRDAIMNPDNARIAYQYGRLLLLRKEPKQGLKQVIKAAEKGHLAAQLLLTSGYSSGNYFKGDAKQAYYWAEKAAAQGSKYAQASAATWQAEGSGTKKDADKGVARLQAYASEGNAFASFSLAVIYRQGQFVKADVDKAISHYDAARKAGLGAAHAALAMMYLGGEAVKKDADRAYDIFLEGAEAGHIGVILLFARNLAEGLLPSKAGSEEAVTWMCKAGKRGENLHFELFKRAITCPAQ